MLRQPKGGIPDDDVNAEDYLLALVPIYGTKDAGRSFWKRMRSVMLESGMVENFVFKACYSYAVDGVIQIIMATHVDDIVWACLPGAEPSVKKLKSILTFGAEDEGAFRYCGKEIFQDPNTFTVKITCTATTMKMKEIDIDPERLKNLALEANKDEKEAMTTQVGILAWIARSCRPSIAYRVSALQGRNKKAVVGDLRTCNQVIKYTLETKDEGLWYHHGLDWSNLVIGYVGDASFSEEKQYNEFTGAYEPFRSQGGRILILANKVLIEGTDIFFHVIGFTSTILRRVCRSTMQAETYNTQYAVESGDIVRAGIADLHGLLDHKQWEASAAAFIHAVWFTDCKSSHDALVAPVQGKSQDKRLGIEIASLRQSIWRKPGEIVGLPHLEEKKPADTTDSIRWIDTDIMLADPLTKTMSASKLEEALRTNRWDLMQPIESLQKKRIKQKQRSAAKTGAKEKLAADNPPRDGDEADDESEAADSLG